VHSPKKIESNGPEPNKFISEQISGKWVFCDCTAVSLPQRSVDPFSRNYFPTMMGKKHKNKQKSSLRNTQLDTQDLSPPKKRRTNNQAADMINK
jgi:hypothetical protein